MFYDLPEHVFILNYDVWMRFHENRSLLQSAADPYYHLCAALQKCATLALMEKKRFNCFLNYFLCGSNFSHEAGGKHAFSPYMWNRWKLGEQENFLCSKTKAIDRIETENVSQTAVKDAITRTRPLLPISTQKMAKNFISSGFILPLCKKKSQKWQHDVLPFILLIYMLLCCHSKRWATTNFKK